jgi:hypothetical protein
MAVAFSREARKSGHKRTNNIETLWPAAAELVWPPKGYDRKETSAKTRFQILIKVHWNSSVSF